MFQQKHLRFHLLKSEILRAKALRMTIKTSENFLRISLLVFHHKKPSLVRPSSNQEGLFSKASRSFNLMITAYACYPVYPQSLYLFYFPKNMLNSLCLVNSWRQAPFCLAARGSFGLSNFLLFIILSWFCLNILSA